MDNTMAIALAQAGGAACLALAAVGSGLGAGAAGSAAVGAWKKCQIQKKPASMLLVGFVGAPLTQTIYGFILQIIIRGKAATFTPETNGAWAMMLIAGIVAGIAMGVSAWMQGRAAASCCDAFAETGEGFTNDLVVLGVIETVALFVMVFTLISI